MKRARRQVGVPRTLTRLVRVESIRSRLSTRTGRLARRFGFWGLKAGKAPPQKPDPALGVRCYNARADGKETSWLDSIESNIGFTA